MRNRVAIAALVLCALAAVFCWWPAANGDAGPMRGQEQARGPAVLAASGSSIDRTEVSTREPVAADEPAPEGVDPPSPFDLRGTFVVVDHDGKEHAAESGVVEVEVDGSGSGFEVKSGAWRMPDFTSRDRLRVVEATLGGKPVVCDIDLALEPSNPPLHLRGRWLAPVRLRVVGSDTGADLANVRLVELSFEEALYDQQHPGTHHEPDASVVVATPVLLWPEPGKLRHYFVGARGYAWSRVDVDPNTSAERWVRLERGGDVDISIVGSLSLGATVRLSRNEGGRPLVEAGLEPDGVTHLEDVPCGVWYVEVTKQHWFQTPLLVLGRSRVEVTAGTVVLAAITLRGDQAPPPSAMLAGTLVYPSAWRNLPRIDIEPAGAIRPWGEVTSLDPERVAIGGDEYRWTAGRKDAGTYQVRVTGSGFLWRFELPPAGDTDVRIVVPEPCDLRVRVLDAETGKVFAIGHEHGWPPVFELTDPEWEGTNNFEHLVLQPDGSYVGQAPPGAIRLYVRPDGYEASDTRQEIVRGTNEFVVSVARACGVDITLLDGDASVPWPDELIASLHDASGRRMNLYESFAVARVAVKAPGEFTLTVPDVDGFEPIPPRTVTVSHATWTKVEIPLQRRR